MSRQPDRKLMNIAQALQDTGMALLFSTAGKAM
jgi:hypothetical protein